jgi:hypothetical protein
MNMYAIIVLIVSLLAIVGIFFIFAKAISRMMNK